MSGFIITTEIDLADCAAQCVIRDIFRFGSHILDTSVLTIMKSAHPTLILPSLNE